MVVKFDTIKAGELVGKLQYTLEEEVAIFEVLNALSEFKQEEE